MGETKLQQFRSMEGTPYQLGPISLAFKRVDGEDDGSYSIIEMTQPPGVDVGQHRHVTFQETFLVCEGTFEFTVGDERRTLGPGEILVIPRGEWHGFTCTSPEPGRLLTISTPAGLFEAFVAEISAANAETGVDRGGPALGIIAARHGMEFR